MRNKQEIEQDIERIEEEMLDMSSSDPQWSDMVSKRNSLLIELEQSTPLTRQQKQCYVEPYTFVK